MEILDANYTVSDHIEPDWETLLLYDNRPRIIDRGTDFSEDVHTMRRHLFARAAQENLDVKVRILLNQRILFQVFDPENDPPVLPALPDQRKKYPWKQWLDGQEWTLVKGVNFTGSTESFRAYIYKIAYSRNRKVSVSRPDEDTLIIQVVDLGPEETTDPS